MLSMLDPLEADAHEGLVSVESAVSPLQQGSLGLAVTNEVLLGPNEALHLRSTLCSTPLEGADNPIAVGLDRCLVFLLVFEVLLVLCHVRLLLSFLLLPLRNHVLQVDLLFLERCLELFGRCELLFELELGSLLCPHVILDLVIQVLHDHGQQLDDALGFMLALALARKLGFWGLICRNIEVGALLCQSKILHAALDGTQLDRVIAVIGGQGLTCFCQQPDGRLVRFFGILESLVLLLALACHR
mmetsp:Transcript_16018/g.44071  ORF Transcript_16018/g.44071 Transcript_16018/m.44071 type:complete len:244 (-) Transcript_16018:1542-2273(-)